MKKILVLAAMMAAVMVGRAEAGLIAYWNFNNPDNNAATSGTGTLAVAQGSGSLSWSGAAANLTYFGGTVTNMLDGDDRGLALALQNGANGANNGAHLEFNVSMTGKSELEISFAGQRTSTGFDSINVQWAVGAGAFNSFTTINDLASSMGTTTSTPAAIRTVNFLAVDSQIANQSDVRIRFVFSGGSTTSSAGNNRFDNVRFSAVPEPSALLLVGSVLGAGFLRRRRS